ncbi:HAD hydrolase-like protein [Nocardioides aestuarii]|uniref:HAD-IIA family hydrolase n=1 Tax=Nocardioides aestuarii TaxID=252231 RepID=A0ABW4TPN0_9ACTN
MRDSDGRPLVDLYDLTMLDLDGVVYVGDRAVPGAAGHLADVRRAGAHVAFVTNNASRSPAAVAEKLTDLGVAAEPGDVVTSSQAAAHLLLEQHGAGATVAVLGAAGLREALEEAGLAPTVVDDDAAVALVTGFGPDVVWHEVMHAAVRIRGGLPWVASNADLTFPSSIGLAPGHGALVGLLSRFADVEPVVAGKPQRPLLDETVRRVGGERPLMVGDRLDTDIEGAHEAGVDSLLVLTGVTGLAELVAAPARHRPTFLAPDLAGLLSAHPSPARDDGTWRCGGWGVEVSGGRLDVRGDGDDADWWRVVAAAAWEHLDTAGTPVDAGGLVPPEQAREG